MTFLGLLLGKCFVEFLGIGLATGLANNPSWAAAFDVSLGALLVEAFSPLGAFGHFCCVVLALGICANVIPSTYSTGLSFQLLDPSAERIPRLFWCTFAVIIYAVCAIAGYKHLLAIFNNFLVIIGYWISNFVVLVLQEHVIFRRKTGWKWDQWDNTEYLPVGIAAFVAFCIGWVGVVLAMDQTYFVGPIAKLVGEHGADVSHNSNFGRCVPSVRETNIFYLDGYTTWGCVHGCYFPYLAILGIEIFQALTEK